MYSVANEQCLYLAHAMPHGFKLEAGFAAAAADYDYDDDDDNDDDDEEEEEDEVEDELTFIA